MIQEIRKELRFGIRSGKLLILTAGFLFFALLTPVMLKYVLPAILGSRFAGSAPQELSGLLDMTQTGCMQSYMGDIFEMGVIIITFTLCGLMAQEIRDNTPVLPLCADRRFGGIIGGKLVVFGAALILIPILSLVVNFVYSGMLFSYEVKVLPMLRGGLLQGVYMVFLLACLVMWGTFLKKPIPAGFLTLATAFGLHFAGGLLDIQTWLPSGLLLEAQRLVDMPAQSLPRTVCITLALVGSMIALTLIRLRKMEWNERHA